MTSQSFFLRGQHKRVKAKSNSRPIAFSTCSVRSFRSAPTSKSTMHLPYLPLHALVMHSDTSTASAKGHISWNRATRPSMITQNAFDTALCFSPSQEKSGIYKGNVWKSGRIYPIITCTHTLLPPSSLHVRPMADAPCIFQMQITEDEDAHKLAPLPPISTSPNTRMLPW